MLHEAPVLPVGGYQDLGRSLLDVCASFFFSLLLDGLDLLLMALNELLLHFLKFVCHVNLRVCRVGKPGADSTATHDAANF